MKQVILPIALVSALAGAQIAIAQQPAALWSRMDKTMSDLLNEGWKITSHTEYVYGRGQVDYSFVLSKDNKAAICFVDDANAKKTTSSACRALN